MPNASGYQDANVMTYGDNAIAEDVTDIIYQLTPEDTPVFNSTGDTRATNVIHQWQTRSIGGRAHNASYEGFNFLFTAPMTYTDARRANVTQIFSKLVRVSGTEQAVKHYGIGDSFADQFTIRGTEIKMDHEHSMINSTLASGQTQTARVQQGLISAIMSGQSTYTSYGSTVSLTETMFNDHLQLCWGYGSKPKDWYVGGFMKRRISGFTAGNTKFIAADAQKAVNTQSVYESDFGVVQIHLCRDILSVPTGLGSSSTVSGHGLLGLDTTFVKKAWLRPLTAERTPKLADSADGVIYSEMTTEFGHPNAHFYMRGSL